jgi:D-glycero-D-manno-heptose 1,7-bisphosphate phosphatase
MVRPRLFIFDVDGTLRWTHTPGQRYPLADGDWSLMPNVGEVLRAIPWSREGPWLGIASNQPAVGAGLLSEHQARRMIAGALERALGDVGRYAEIEMCVCPDDVACSRKKPNPGMLTVLAKKFAVSRSDALFVGDQPIDAEAAARAGMAFIWAHEFFGFGFETSGATWPRPRSRPFGP